MDLGHRTSWPPRGRSRARAFRRRALETSYWVVAAILLVVYCGVRSYDDLEWQLISILSEPSEPVRVDDDARLAAGGEVLSIAPTGSDRDVTIVADRAGSIR